jgi:DNA-binding MarR family transcriptional regulator
VARRDHAGAADRADERMTVPRGQSPATASARELPVERDVEARIGELGVDADSMAAISNIFRVATTIRNHMERTVLDGPGLSFTAFTVLWVLWIWGEQEARHVADESGLSRGTLTGVVTTLEKRGLVRRRAHPDDKRSVLVAMTDRGESLMVALFPTFNAEEAKVSADLTGPQKDQLADALRTILRTVERLDR